MDAKTERLALESKLMLRDRSDSPLTVHTVTLSLTKQNDALIQCRLTFQISPELYQRIDTEVLFNLKPELRVPFTAKDFLPSPDIEISASLKPDLLPCLVEHATDVNQAAAYILNLNQEKPDDPLLSTESWLGLSVKQSHKSSETGYRTFWSYVSPTVLSGAAADSEEINDGIANFFKDLFGGTLEQAAKEFTTQSIAELANFFKQLADDTPKEIPQDTTNTQPIFQAMVNFFKEDDWPFALIEGEPALRLAFEGENGFWNCYAKAREQQQQMVFYSICPVNAPENKRQAIAEFLTRVNLGMIIGNFELDLSDGEIRYKTSIDVEGDRLSWALIKRLVYANVTMMDEYLPGIMSVIYGDVSPKSALAQIEG